MVNRKVNHKVKRVVNRQTKPASNRYLSSREVGMVSVETALSIGPLIAVVGLLLMPLFGWIYAADAEILPVKLRENTRYIMMRLRGFPVQKAKGKLYGYVKMGITLTSLLPANSPQQCRGWA